MEARSKLVKRPDITDAAVSAFADSSAPIPEKYIRTEELVLDGGVVDDGESYEFPVIDMTKLLDPESSSLEIKKLGDACRNWGFFQLTNHGVDEAAIREMKNKTVEFFGSPLESKKSVAVRGNSYEGYGHHFSVVTDKLDWAESVILTMQPVEARNMEIWPKNPPTFKHAAVKYSEEIANLTSRLMRFMAADIGVEEETLQGAFRGQGQTMAIHYYPPCQHREKVMGITPHTDGLGLTLLLHVDDTPGLQIMKDGRWFPVRPLPEAIVVNIADILGVLTNGRYRSVEHRVIPDAERGRTTVVVFQMAAVGGLVAPLPALLEGKGEEARFRSVELEEYIDSHFRALAVGARFIDNLRT